MVFWRTIPTGIAIAALWLMSASVARADFAADQFMTVTGRERDDVLPSKIYTQGKKTRIEMTTAGRNTVSISRGDKKPPVFWNLMPEEKMYMELTGEGGSTGALSQKPAGGIEKVFIAKETVDGHPCNKFKIIWRDKEGEPQTGRAWEATDLDDTPIRQEFYHNGERVLVELKNIEIKKLNADLFEIPAGFKKFSMPPGPMGPPTR